MGREIIIYGWGSQISVNDGRLFIKNGNRSSVEKPETYFLIPDQKKITEILIYGQSGYISLEAFKWISLQNIQLNIFNWDGGYYLRLIKKKMEAGNEK